MEFSTGPLHTRDAQDGIIPNGILDFAKLTYHLTTSGNTANGTPPDTSQTGCTDHMLLCHWTVTKGWEAPVIEPYGALPIMPSSSVLHYGTECFEGIKAYRGFDGKLRLFRVELNCERFLKSSLRIGLPYFDPKELEKLLRAFVVLEARHWLPTERKGETLYVRPTHIGTTAMLGFQKPRDSTLFMIATLAPGFTPREKGGMTVLTSPKGEYRAWPGGFGDAKVGANYGPTLVAHAEATERGFDQVLWLFGEAGYVTEAGASNFFVVWRTKKGTIQLVTAGLENKTILEGITRKSILELANHRKDNSEQWKIDGEHLESAEVIERDFSIGEIKEAIEDGRLIEAFVSGTAYFIAPIRLIRHLNDDLVIPCIKGNSGHYAALFKKWLADIVYGWFEFSNWTTVLEENGNQGNNARLVRFHL